MKHLWRILDLLVPFTQLSDQLFCYCSFVLLPAPHLKSIISLTPGSCDLFKAVSVVSYHISNARCSSKPLHNSKAKPSSPTFAHSDHHYLLGHPPSHSLRTSGNFHVILRSGWTTSAPCLFRLCPRVPPPRILCLSTFHHPRQQD